jgi:serine/threonine-protein kinase
MSSPSPTLTITYAPTITTPETTATSAALPKEITDEKSVQMALVSAGEFTMGGAEAREYTRSPAGRRVLVVESGHVPAHTVYLDSYYIDKYEVTNAHYRKCVSAGVCGPPYNSSSYDRPSYYENREFEDYPVIYVNQEMASTFCEWRGARLPSEAEWEKAARGTDERLFAWGNEPARCGLANIGLKTPCDGDTTRVGSYLEDMSPYGIFDMTGNVSEWTTGWSSWYDIKFIVWRGGSWTVHNPPEYANRLYLRNYGGTPDSGKMDVGFRCVRSISP